MGDLFSARLVCRSLAGKKGIGGWVEWVSYFLRDSCVGRSQASKVLAVKHTGVLDCFRRDSCVGLTRTSKVLGTRNSGY